jgi:hypothetical protein
MSASKGQKYKSGNGDVAVVVDVVGDQIHYNMEGVAYEGDGAHHFQSSEDFEREFPEAA